MDRHAEMSLFVQAVDHKGFSQAARVLRVAPSVVSRSVQRLEERLGVTLIQRTTRSFVLTARGRAYYDGALELLRRSAALDHDVAARSESLEGPLRLALSPGLARHHVVPRLGMFAARHPLLKLELVLSDQYLDFTQDGIDVAIRIGAPVREPQTLKSTTVRSFARVLCAAPSYLAAHGVPRAPRDLVAHACLALTVDEQPRRWELIGPRARPHVVTFGSASISASTVDCLQDAAIAGLGIARLSTAFADAALRDGRLVAVLPAYRPSGETRIRVVWPPTRERAARARAVIRFLDEILPAATPTTSARRTAE